MSLDVHTATSWNTTLSMDTFASWPLIKALIPKVPLIGKTALYHTLGVSENCKEWDLKTELTINVLRSFITVSPRPHGVLQSQQDSLKDPGIKGEMWISKVKLPTPAEDSIREALFKAIEAMKEPDAGSGGYTEPELRPVEAEWTGHRAGATKNSPELQIPEAQKYEELMKEVTSPATVLYFHGGAHYLLDPASHRGTTAKLAKLTKGRCLNVRYRLSPQNPFPAALLDALVAYFSLLYPPPGSLHTPVSASHIVFAGDSAGGNISFGLLQALLQFRRMNIKVRWNGEDRDVPLPAGGAGDSPWMDVTYSMPSCQTNAKFDYLPAHANASEGVAYPPDEIWPAKPPRRQPYAEDQVVCHPIVSPAAAKLQQWEGCCPLWISTGQEQLADEGKFVAMLAAQTGVKVIYEEFEAMPHCFALVLVGSEAGRKCFEGWTNFITAAVEHPETIKTRGVRYHSMTLAETEVDVEKVSPFTEEEVVGRMKAWVREGSAAP